ncbi:hypothetical protein ERJ75_000504500 [Trypanosoma vivax]|nr:hypothetical protein ERJ75_000612200 [Trypanosoma vivax]KAH8616189.1 hypothetical protein ERJ75_000504500 [Trypanosoma vivax]
MRPSATWALHCACAFFIPLASWQHSKWRQRGARVGSVRIVVSILPAHAKEAAVPQCAWRHRARPMRALTRGVRLGAGAGAVHVVFVLQSANCGGASVSRRACFARCDRSDKTRWWRGAECLAQCGRDCLLAFLAVGFALTDVS